MSYCVIRWAQDMKSRGWPRYEVRTSAGVDPSDPRYRAVARGLSFAEAITLRDKLEAVEKKRPVDHPVKAG